MSYHNQQISYTSPNYQQNSRVNKPVDSYTANTNIISRNMQPVLQHSNNLSHSNNINQQRNYTPNHSSSMTKQQHIVHQDNSRSPQPNPNNVNSYPMQYHHPTESSKKLINTQSHGVTIPASNQVQNEGHQFLNRYNF